jgi:hypothetical protein
MTSDDKAISYVPQIQAAHDKAIAAQQTGHEASLKAAIEAGELLIDAKDAVGTGGWTKWRERHLPDISQPTVSLYMRLAENKDRFKERAISNAVTTLRDRGELSIRKAAALIRKTGTRKSKPKSAAKGDEEVGRAWLGGLEVDELIIWLKQLHEPEYRKKLWASLGQEFTARPATPAPAPVSVGLDRRA